MRTLILTRHVRPSDQAIPLAAACLKASLPQQLQEQTEIINLYPDDCPQQTVRKLLAREPDVVALSLCLWSRQPLLELARLLRQARPDVYILAGGPEISGDCRRLLAEGPVDAVIYGEGELAFAATLDALRQKTSPASIEGFCAAGHQGSVAPAVCPDLALLPSPWLEGHLPLVTGGGVLWEVARGCHFNCAFCHDAKGVRGVRPFPFTRLRQELELFAAKGIGQVWILDSTFNAPPERGKQLLHLLLEVAPQIHYHIEAKADFLDRQTIALLSQLSCSVQIGLQSARPEILQPLHRQLNLKKFTRVTEQLNRAGVVFGLDLIYGLPGDNHTGFTASLEFALQQQPNQVDIFPLSLLPGTELYQQQEAFGISGSPHPPYQLTGNRSYPPEELQTSAQLAAATDIFYNRGRAVGFFLQVCASLNTSGVDLLRQFTSWLTTEGGYSPEQILAAESWTPDIILPLQQDFIARQLHRSGRGELIPVSADLILYHYLCAETLLAAPCQGTTTDVAGFARKHWQLHPHAHLARFHYDVKELEEVGGWPLTAIVRELDQDPGYSLFFNQQGEPFIEVLDETFAEMLLRAKAGAKGSELLKGLDPQDAREMISSALKEGLLQQVI